MDLDPDACYRAVVARDGRFDGRFLTAVRTTRVFCRPSCPSRTPRRPNVEFFPHPAAARQAGYRACKRCRPEAAPGDPQWDLRADVVGRAVRLIAAEGLPGGVGGLAARLAVGERHLRRLFEAEVGAGPLQVAAAHRLALARLLVEQTDLPLTTVAFAAGFGSVRRFNAAMAGAFGCPPSSLRRGTAGRFAGLTVQLPARAPFDGPGVLSFLAAHRTPGVEEVDGGTYRRTVDGGLVEVTLDPGAAGVTVGLALDDVGRIGAAVALVRRLFDLDADPAAVDAALAGDPALAPLVRRWPGVRLPGAASGFEAAARTVLGQQVSTVAAATLAGRLAARLGTPAARPAGGLRWLFPTAEQVAAAGPAAVAEAGLPAGRARALTTLAEAVAAGRLDLEPGADRRAAEAGLLAIAGVGPWTASIVAARALHDPDALPASDLALRRVLGGGDADLRRRAEAWRPWRSYAAFLVWRSTGEGRP